jgi:hypothetical protein
MSCLSAHQREHTIQALNTKVSDLQAIVARSIKTQGSVLEPSNPSIVDIKTWLASSPDHVVCLDPHSLLAERLGLFLISELFSPLTTALETWLKFLCPSLTRQLTFQLKIQT